MNTSRMDMVLNRQKRSLVEDALYAMVVIAGVLFYLFGLGASRGLVANAPHAQVAPAEIAAPAQHDALCAHEPQVRSC